MKPLIVGESNPYQRDEESAMRYAMYPEPRGCSGWRLCRVIMGIDERQYLRAFDRIDLCHPTWSIVAARRHAGKLVSARQSSDVIVLCGAKVASAFGVPYKPFEIYDGGKLFAVFSTEHDTLNLPRFVVLPHPSGLNRAWHQPGAVQRARSVLREVGALP